jgi:hypothetical protein
MNRKLAKAVVAAFRTDEPEIARRRFEGFCERDWAQTQTWLHTSGMALYFLDRATMLGIEDVMPAALLHELSMNLAENRVRTADLFEEFSRLNSDFQRAGISYVNVKGFSLAPEAFADPAFRYQLDLDFLVARRDMERCAQILAQYGYRRGVSFTEAWEFKSGAPAKISLRDLYRARPGKEVELHPLPEEEEARAGRGGDRLSRMKLRVWNGFEFPALSDADQLLSQGLHIFQHLQGEWTRTAWLLEYSNAIRARQNDDEVWRDAAVAVNAAPEIRIGLAVATFVTEFAFGTALPREFREQTIGLLRPDVRLWVERYREVLMLNEHPGSKLYLLLGDVLDGDHVQWLEKRRRRLLPLHVPVRVMPKERNDLRLRWTLETAQLRFSAHRLWFHLAEGLRYKMEAARWRRFVARAGL